LPNLSESSLRSLGHKGIEILPQEESKRLEEEIFDPLWEGLAGGIPYSYKDL